MNEPLKKPKNPLFSASVTGGTFEDFSQNAILLPAKEKPPPPTLNLSHEQILNDIISPINPNQVQPETGAQFASISSPPNQNFPGSFTEIPTAFPQELPDISTLQPHLTAPSSNASSLSSVFSSFSNILNIGTSSNKQVSKEEDVIRPPAGIESLIAQENSNPQPVPLFSADSVEFAQQKPPSTTGPSNQFRRSGLKRPAYAQIPGLSNTPQSIPQQNIPPQNLPPQNIPPLPVIPQSTSQSNSNTLFTPSAPSPANSLSSSSSFEVLQTLPNQFKPISPPPPQSLQNIHSVSQPLAPIPVQPLTFQQQTPNPLASFPQQTPSSLVSFPQQTQSPLASFPQQTPNPLVSFPQQAPNPLASLSQQAPSPLASFPQQTPNPLVSFPQQAPNPLASFPQQTSVNFTPSPLGNFTQFPPATFAEPPPINFETAVTTPPVNFFHSVPTSSFSGTILSPLMDATEVPQGPGMNTASVDTVTTVTSPGDCGDVNPPVNQVYRPVYHHWFFQKEVEDKKIWQPFSMVDSLALEHAFTSNDLDPEKVIATDGGRYDVNILRRQRNSVYWKADPNEVRRCSWFHKSTPDGRLIPYEENVAAKLEEEYKIAYDSNQWHRKIDLPGGETIVLHGPDVLVLFSPTQVPDAWGNTPNQSRPRVVKRGMDEFDIDEGEPAHVDHILFMVHGIGSVCDLKFRTVEEVVDEFRNIAFQLVQSHYRSSCDTGKVNRVEVLPISWHDRLHSEETGIDQQLKNITLESIPKLRNFTNDTLLDILFYTSPIYCQKIISTVGTELNRIYDLFKQRNPHFKGGVSLGGHSLGSLILFDLLCHQVSKPESDSEESSDDILSKPHPKDRRMNKRISYMMGSIGTGQPQIHYPRLSFEPKTFFALGSPIGMFVIIRGLDNLGENFSLPTCPGFFNIFHPYDPIAYRIESLINSKFESLKPVLIPHHKGRKRMHLELKETMARVGADLKQKVVDSMRNTWNSVYQLAMFHKQSPPNLEEEVSKAFRDQIGVHEELENDQIPDSTGGTPIGNLNNGRRVDYVLQEAPFEFFNEYIFALTSHVCYWESEDTILLMLKEIYTSMGITSDNQIPQQTMTIERPPPSPTSLRAAKIGAAIDHTLGMDPTRPIQMPTNIQPPPVAGFVRNT